MLKIQDLHCKYSLFNVLCLPFLSLKIKYGLFYSCSESYNILTQCLQKLGVTSTPYCSLSFIFLKSPSLNYWGNAIFLFFTCGDEGIGWQANYIPGAICHFSYAIVNIQRWQQKSHFWCSWRNSLGFTSRIMGVKKHVSHCGCFSNSFWYLDEENGQCRPQNFLESIWEAIETCVVMIITHYVGV